MNNGQTATELPLPPDRRIKEFLETLDQTELIHMLSFGDILLTVQNNRIVKMELTQRFKPIPQDC